MIFVPKLSMFVPFAAVMRSLGSLAIIGTCDCRFSGHTLTPAPESREVAPTSPSLELHVKNESASVNPQSDFLSSCVIHDVVVIKVGAHGNLIACLDHFSSRCQRLLNSRHVESHAAFSGLHTRNSCFHCSNFNIHFSVQLPVAFLGRRAVRTKFSPRHDIDPFLVVGVPNVRHVPLAIVGMVPPAAHTCCSRSFLSLSFSRSSSNVFQALAVLQPNPRASMFPIIQMPPTSTSSVPPSSILLACRR